MTELLTGLGVLVLGILLSIYHENKRQKTTIVAGEIQQNYSDLKRNYVKLIDLIDKEGVSNMHKPYLVNGHRRLVAEIQYREVELNSRLENV